MVIIKEAVTIDDSTVALTAQEFSRKFIKITKCFGMIYDTRAGSGLEGITGSNQEYYNCFAASDRFIVSPTSKLRIGFDLRTARRIEYSDNESCGSFGHEMYRIVFKDDSQLRFHVNV